MVAQPGAQRLRIGNARLAETKQGTYLGALPLRRAIGGIGQQRFTRTWFWHAEAARQLRHCGPVHLGSHPGEAATGAEEQQHDGEAQPVGPALGLDQRPVRQRQVPSLVVNGCAHAGGTGPTVTTAATATLLLARQDPPSAPGLTHEAYLCLRSAGNLL